MWKRFTLKQSKEPKDVPRLSKVTLRSSDVDVQPCSSRVTLRSSCTEDGVPRSSRLNKRSSDANIIPSPSRVTMGSSDAEDVIPRLSDIFLTRSDAGDVGQHYSSRVTLRSSDEKNDAPRQLSAFQDNVRKRTVEAPTESTDSSSRRWVAVTESELRAMERAANEKAAMERAEKDKAEWMRFKHERADQESTETNLRVMERAANKKAAMERAEKDKAEWARFKRERAERESTVTKPREMERSLHDEATMGRAVYKNAPMERPAKDEDEWPNFLSERVVQKPAEAELTGTEREREQHDYMQVLKAEREKAVLESQRAELEMIRSQFIGQESPENETAEGESFEALLERAERESFEALLEENRRFGREIQPSAPPADQAPEPGQPPELCFNHSSQWGCGDGACQKLHLCHLFLAGICKHEPCRHGHSLATAHNKAVMLRAGLDVSRELAALQVLRAEFERRGAMSDETYRRHLELCFKFPLAGGCQELVCKRLHLCKMFVAGTCPYEKCKFGHNLRTLHNSLVLSAHKAANLTDSDIVDLLIRNYPRLKAEDEKPDGEIHQQKTPVATRHESARGGTWKAAAPNPASVDADQKAPDRAQRPHAAGGPGEQDGGRGVQDGGGGVQDGGGGVQDGGRGEEDGGLSGELQCPICLELLERATTIACGHTFCAGCLAALRVATCPVCRAPVSGAVRVVALDNIIKNMAARR